MMVILDNKVAFYHLPRTGGTLLKHIARQHDVKLFSPDNLITKEDRYYNKEIDPSLYKFGFVRNPWEWCVSFSTLRVSVEHRRGYPDNRKKIVHKIKTHMASEMVKYFHGYYGTVENRMKVDWLGDVSGREEVFEIISEILGKDLIGTLKKTPPVNGVLTTEKFKDGFWKFIYSLEEGLKEHVEKECKPIIDEFGYTFD